MNSKGLIAGVVIVALAVALVLVNHNASERHQADDASIHSLSNQLVTARANMEEEVQVNIALSNNLATTTTDYSNKLSSTETDLHTTQSSLDKAVADAKAAADAAALEMAKRDKRIADLETQNEQLDKQSVELHGEITDRESKIADVQKKLDASEGDRDLLLKELKRLQAEKADLEKKFNDLAVLRDQVRKLREELSISRRLDWIRRGIYETLGEKGGERLIHQNESSVPPTNASLNVELHESPVTNTPAITNPPPQ